MDNSWNGCLDIYSTLKNNLNMEHLYAAGLNRIIKIIIFWGIPGFRVEGSHLTSKNRPFPSSAINPANMNPIYPKLSIAIKFMSSSLQPENYSNNMLSWSLLLLFFS
jgi:hypothetical protein